MSSGSESQQPSQLALPSPPDAVNAQESMTTGSKEETNMLKFDELGPMIINNDGTLSRITNWIDMTERERERTLRVLNARNKLRLADEQAKAGQPDNSQVVGLARSTQ